MSIVYQVQQSGMFVKSIGQFVPFDTSQAEAFGEIKVMLPSSRNQFDLSDEFICQTLVMELEDFTEEDYLLLMGTPRAMAAAAAIAADNTDGMVQVLNWDKHTKRYVVSVLEV